VRVGGRPGEHTCRLRYNPSKITIAPLTNPRLKSFRESSTPSPWTATCSFPGWEPAAAQGTPLWRAVLDAGYAIARFAVVGAAVLFLVSHL
jgi:hypothetical protein